MVLVWLAQLHGYAQCSCSGSSSSVSFGETGNSSITLKKNQWMAELYGDYRSFAQSKTTHDHSHHDMATMTDSASNVLQSIAIAVGGIRYGVTNRITISLQQPNIWLNAKPQSATGIGDLLVTATAKIFDKNDFSGALIVGVELPTGVKSKLSGENNLAIGSGSFDPIIGLVLVKGWQKSFIRANVFYKHVTIGFDKTNYGSFFNPSLTFNYKLKGLNQSCVADSLNNEPNNFSWTVFANIAGEWYGTQLKENTIIDNTGGYMLLAAVGTQLGFGKWTIPLSCTIPAMQELNGEQSQTNYRIKIGLIKTF